MTLFSKDQLLVPVFMKRGKEEDGFQNSSGSFSCFVHKSFCVWRHVSGRVGRINCSLCQNTYIMWTVMCLDSFYDFQTKYFMKNESFLDDNGKGQSCVYLVLFSENFTGSNLILSLVFIFLSMRGFLDCGSQ